MIDEHSTRTSSRHRPRWCPKPSFCCHYSLPISMTQGIHILKGHLSKFPILDYSYHAAYSIIAVELSGGTIFWSSLEILVFDLAHVPSDAQWTMHEQLANAFHPIPSHGVNSWPLLSKTSLDHLRPTNRHGRMAIMSTARSVPRIYPCA